MYEYTSLSSSQEVLMYSTAFTPWHRRMEHEGLMLNMYFIVKEDCDIQALQDAYNHLVRHNDALRLYFAKRNGKLLQRVKEWEYCEIERARVESAEGFQKFLSQLWKYPVKVKNSVPIRPILVEFGNGGGALVIRAHHLLVDGFSESLIFKQLEACYHAYSNGVEPELKPVVSIVGSYQKEQAYFKSDACKKNQDYWKQKVMQQTGFQPVLQKYPDQKAIVLRTELGKELSNRLIGLTEEYQVSIEATVSLIVALTVYREKNITNFAFSSAIHGRYSFKEKNQIGCRHGLVPLLFDLKVNMPFEEFLKQYYQDYMMDMSRSHISNAQKYQIFEPLRNRGKADYGVYTWLVFSSMDYEDAASSEFEVGDYDFPYIDYQMYLGMFASKDKGIRFLIWHTKRPFTSQIMQHLLEEFRYVAQAVAGNPKILLSELQH